MRDTIAEFAERLDAFRGDGESPGFGDVARILFELKLDEMTRTGRHATMTRLLEEVLRDSRAARLSEDVYQRNR